MFDRFINVSTISIILLSLVVLCFNLYNEYSNIGYEYNISDAKPSEINNENMVIDENIRSVVNIKTAIYKARKAGARKDVQQLEKYFNRSYKADNTRRNRINSMDLRSSFIFSGMILFLLIIPFSINYIRHGKPKIWNGKT